MMLDEYEAKDQFGYRDRKINQLIGYIKRLTFTEAERIPSFEDRYYTDEWLNAKHEANEALTRVDEMRMYRIYRQWVLSEVNDIDEELWEVTIENVLVYALSRLLGLLAHPYISDKSFDVLSFPWLNEIRDEEGRVRRLLPEGM